MRLGWVKMLHGVVFVISVVSGVVECSFFVMVVGSFVVIVVRKLVNHHPVVGTLGFFELRSYVTKNDSSLFDIFVAGNHGSHTWQGTLLRSH